MFKDMNDYNDSIKNFYTKYENERDSLEYRDNLFAIISNKPEELTEEELELKGKLEYQIKHNIFTDYTVEVVKQEFDLD